MQRRTFIQAALAALAAPSLASAELLAPAPNPVVWNTATLTAELQKMFACQTGPAAPFFNMVNGTVTQAFKVLRSDPKYPNQHYMEWAEPPKGAKRYIYETYACAIEGGSAEEAEARLAKHFFDEFSKLPTGQLVWRVTPQFASHEDIKWGVTYATKTAIEDRLVDLTKLPDDAQYDPVMDSYRQVLRKTTLHKMRMRLVLPHLYNEETVALPNLLKAEGARITKII